MSQIEILKILEKREVAGMVFIRNYLQILFGDPTLSAFVWPVVYTRNKIFNIKTPGYRDALCEQIGKQVISAKETPNEKIVISLADGSLIDISINEEDRTGPEAVMIQANVDNLWHVW